MTDPARVLPARVLIVDNEAYNRDVLTQELDLLGHQTVAAVDGLEALARIADTPVDVVLLDIMMPNLDGYGVLERLKKGEFRHVPVIMISSLGDMASVVRCIELGAEDYLPKPFDPVLLKARIGACLEKKRLHDAEAAYRETIERQLQEIKRERQQSDRFLHAILPAPAVRELKSTARVAPRRYDDVAVLFTDIIDSTRYFDSHPPEVMVTNLGELFEACELLVAEHGLEMIKTTGDGVCVTGNLLHANRDPVMAVVRCALDLTKSATENAARWQIRVGIHFGSVVAGVVGRDKFSFDLWGDTVNVAARLSSLGTTSAIQLSREAWAQVADRCHGVALGPTPIKGKGDVEVFRCDRLRG